jgi:hypothetical protein
MKTVASKMLFTLLSLVMVMLFLAVALLIGHRTVWTAPDGHVGLLFIALALGGIATSFFKGSDDSSTIDQYQDCNKESITSDLFHGILR